LQAILRAITETLEQTPPELCSDIDREGILLAGGGTLLHSFADLVAAETGTPTYLTESPLTCVAVGSGHALEHYDELNGSATGRRGRAAALTTG
jgi:rod shape-determining protein MreB and related proteins